MSERRKLSLPTGKPAPDEDTPRRKPVRPNAPIARNRVRQAPAEPVATPAPREPREARPKAQAEQRPSPRPARQEQEPRRAATPRQDPRQDQRQDPRSNGNGNTSNRPGNRSDPRHAPRQETPYGRDERPAPRQDHRRNDAPAAMRRPEPSNRQAPEDGRVRLSKLMSEQGLSSRREADDWIEQGWVRVDGEVVSELGTRVWPNQTITIDPLAHAQQAMRVTILIHKPIGFVSGQAEDGHEPAVVLVRPENRWSGDTLPWQLTRGHLNKLAPAGRLDIDSTGLLVLTQDGRIARHLIGEDSTVEKEYLVRVQWERDPEAENVMAVTPPEAIEHLRHGLWLDERPLRPAKVSWQNEQQLRFVLKEGKKRQIRRMCELVGLKVVGLKRVRMGQLTLGKLPLGQWRFLRPDEQF